jgi:uncharacterized protein involved in exopolysaccharide biosynthesis
MDEFTSVMVPIQQKADDRSALLRKEFRFFLHHWRALVLFAVLGSLSGWVATLFIKPYYRAEAVLFPAVTTSVSKALLSDQRTSGDDILAFGGEHDLEHLMQLLRSATIRERANERFDLSGAYGIAPDDRYPQSTLAGYYEDQVTFEKTRYNSIKLEVEDTDAGRATALADFICAEVDSVWRDMRAERIATAIAVLDQQIARADANIRSLQDSLSRLHDQGIHDYRSQAERYHEYLGAAIVKNDQRAVAALEDRFDRMTATGPAYVIVEEALVKAGWRKNELLARREVLYAELGSRLPFMFVLDRASALDKPVRPVRWLSVLIGCLSGMLSVLAFLLLRSALMPTPETHENRIDL